MNTGNPAGVSAPAWARVAGALAALAMVLVVAGADARAELKRAGSSTVRQVVDGDTVALEDGREVRLVGIQAPKLPLGRRGFRAWPLAAESKAALEKLALGKRVTLSFGGRRRDRHRRWLAHLHLGDGTWIQGAMLTAGMARVYSFPDNRAVVGEMLKRERAARAARRGIWGHPYYRILDHRAAGRRVNAFQLVEGRILKIGRSRGRVFLNFGTDWKRDFTIVVERRWARQFPERGRGLVKLAGQRVRVRGWLKWRNGPMIAVTHPEQIEVLGR